MPAADVLVGAEAGKFEILLPAGKFNRARIFVFGFYFEPRFFGARGKIGNVCGRANVRICGFGKVWANFINFSGRIDFITKYILANF